MGTQWRTIVARHVGPLDRIWMQGRWVAGTKSTELEPKPASAQIESTKQGKHGLGVETIALVARNSVRRTHARTRGALVIRAVEHRVGYTEQGPKGKSEPHNVGRMLPVSRSPGWNRDNSSPSAPNKVGYGRCAQMCAAHSTCRAAVTG